MSRAAVFLDRDGVLNAPVLNLETGEHESPHRADELELLDGAVEALRLLARLGAPLVVVSNQPSAAKGKATLAELAAVHERLAGEIAAAGVAIAQYRYCHHHPQGVDPELGRACDCRKPAPGMLLAAAEELDLDLTASWLIGDSDVDVLAGRAAGCRTVLVEEPRSAHRRSGAVPDDRAQTVLEAARIVQGRWGTRRS